MAGLRQIGSISKFEDTKKPESLAALSVHERKGSGLPEKQKLFGSTIKSQYIDHLRTTFALFDPEIGSLARKKLQSAQENQHFFSANSLIPQPAKTYEEIQAQILSERKGCAGYQPPIEKEKRISVKGIYNIHIPTSGELYMRAKEWRMLANPFAHNEEMKRDKLDRKLLEKRKEQRILKNKAIEAYIKAKEKAFAKELKKQNEGQ